MATKNPIQELQDNASGAVYRMHVIADSLKAAAGTQAAILKAAGLDSLNEAVTFPDDMAPVTDSETLADLASWLVDANEWAAQVHAEARDTLIKSRSTGSDDSAALREEFATLKQAVEAFLVLAPGLGIADDTLSTYVIPDLRGSTSGSKGTRTVKTSGVQYGRVVQGVDTPQSDQQNSMSSMCYYHWHKPGMPWGSKKEGSKPTTDEFRKFLADTAGRPVDTMDSQPWECEVGGVTYYLRVIEAPKEG